MTAAITALLVIVALVAGGAPARAAEHAHHSRESALTLDQGRKWPTDAPLRQGMARIRVSMARALPGVRNGAFGASDYRTLAADIESSVTYVVENCTLQGDADAVLHGLISELLEGAQTMQGNSTVVSAQKGVAQVSAALAEYGRLFDDPGWAPLTP